MTTAKTDYAENLVLKFLLTDEVATRPTEWYGALHTGDPGDAGTANELTPGSNGYARQPLSFAVTGNSAENEEPMAVFGPCTGVDWGAVTHVSIKTAVTGGQSLYKGALNAPRTIEVGDSVTLGPGDLTATED